MTLSTDPNKKPLLFFLSFPGDGHFGPISTIAAYMVKRGYEVAFMCSATYKDKIVKAGAEFLEMPGAFDADFLANVPELPASSHPLSQFASQFAYIFFKRMPIRVQKAVAALELLQKRDPERQIIVVEGTLNLGTMPLKYGGPLPEGFRSPPKRIGISTIALLIESQDTGPVMLGLPPDSTESGRLRNRELNRLVNDGPMRPLSDAWAEALTACQCTVAPTGSPVNALFTNYDATFLLCSPSLDYPLSDIPSVVHFAGCLPRRDVSASFEYPDWWPEVAENAAATGEKKKIVFVSQGTVNTDCRELIVPTMKALSGRDDVLVIATLGIRGSKMPEDIEVPANTRVIDYLPYDVILEHSDVFVSNAGYGALGHAVMNGVPAVFAGEKQEKSDVISRATWAGFAVSLKTQTPTPEQVGEGVGRILGDPKYKKRSMELRRENEEMNSLGRIEQKVIEFTEL